MVKMKLQKNKTRDLKRVQEVFDERLHRHYDELKWRYFELFPETENDDSRERFAELIDKLRQAAVQRSDYLTKLDEEREAAPNWYKKSSMLGMMMHVDCFSQTLKGFEKRIPYLIESGISFVQLLPTVWHKPKKHFSGTVADFCKRKKGIGDIKDFVKFAAKCHENGISIAMKLAVNSLDESSEWAFDYTLLEDFNAIAFNVFDTANCGVDMIQLDIVRSTWMDDGGALHNVLRMLRILCEIACPAAVLIGKLDMPPELAAAYIGTKDAPECHLLDNIAMRDVLWHTAATKNTVLLRRQIDMMAARPELYRVNMNYLRANYGLDWNLDYGFLSGMSTDEAAHKNYLNQFYCGKFPGSVSRGALFSDERTDRRYVCGTAASLCGIEKSFDDKDKHALQNAVNLDLILHAAILMQPGVPLIYSGDEIAAFNDDSFRKNKETKSDVRYLHNGPFNWRKAGRRRIKGSVQSQLYQPLRKMEQLRSECEVLGGNASIYTLDTWNEATLAAVRENDAAKLICLFNFADEVRPAWIKADDGTYTDLLTGQTNIRAVDVQLEPYQMLWLWRSKNE